MQRVWQIIVFCFFSILILSGCKSSGTGPSGGPGGGLVNPADANALTQVLVIPNAQRSQGNPPPTSSDTNRPSVSGSLSDQTSSNGSTVQIPFDFTTNVNLGGCYIQVDGASSYFTIPYGDTSGTSGALTIPITIPTNVDSGIFSVNYCVYDTSGLVSNVLGTTVRVLRLGTGALQISLSWDTATDVDLWVTDPPGTRIYYGNPSSASGGQLDRDDTDGYGPENIFWTQNAPDGLYRVEVNYYSGAPTQTNYIVTVNGFGVTRTFNGSLATDGQTNPVTNFTKQGNTLTFP